VTSAPAVPEFAVRRVDDFTLEVDISKEQNLNDLFARLTTLGIDVLSMRNKVNRLEEIFMRLVENRGAANA
jgi:ABC-2 type transport system ATP-binding protein